MFGRGFNKKYLFLPFLNLNISELIFKKQLINFKSRNYENKI